MAMPLEDAGWHGTRLSCPVCGTQLAPDGESEDFDAELDLEMCEHVFYQADEYAAQLLSEECCEQLEAAGFQILDNPGDGYLVSNRDANEAPNCGLRQVLEFVALPGAKMFYQRVGPPGFMEFYWGVQTG